MYPSLSRYLIKEFLQVVVEVLIVELLALFVTFGAENFGKGPAILLTEGVQNLRLDELLTLIAITHGNLGGLMNLTRYPEQMRENVRKFDVKPLQDVKLNHDEGNREERPGRVLLTRAPIGQHVKMFRQIKAPPRSRKRKSVPETSKTKKVMFRDTVD